MIARSVTAQFTAGWDWMQPVHDRSAGLWDSVELRITGPAALQDLHIMSGQVSKAVPLQDRAAVQVGSLMHFCMPFPSTSARTGIQTPPTC